jgi:photoactive yellow protein
MLDELDDHALDELPFGVVKLCLSGGMRVLRMNRTESEKCGIQAWRAVGRGFFDEVAPGPTNQALAEQIRAFAASNANEQQVVHTFARRAGADPTTIELRRAEVPSRVYLCIRRD